MHIPVIAELFLLPTRVINVKPTHFTKWSLTKEIIELTFDESEAGEIDQTKFKTGRMKAETDKAVTQ